MKLRHASVLTALCFVGSTLGVMGRHAEAQSAQLDPNWDLVPQQLLGLVHAPEVHDELKLTKTQVRNLEAFFSATDGEWFRARILPAEKQFKFIAGLESRAREWLRQNVSAQQFQRLGQLEYRALGIRMLLRPEVAQQLNLDEGQKQQLAKLARAANEATEQLRLATMRNKVTDEQESAVIGANAAEQNALKTVVRPDQLQKLGQILGEPFDTRQLKRIYPMAPELVKVDHWINSKPLTLKQLRGKVVLVHFYAFQCHNCHANFGHYSKWHNEFSDDEVVVLGIQTPETPRERDPTAVRTAAAERKLEFPILVDLESENWKTWSNTMWPTVYVIDKQGYLRHWWQGELNWQGATGDQTIHDLVTQLLAEDFEA